MTAIDNDQSPLAGVGLDPTKKITPSKLALASIQGKYKGLLNAAQVNRAPFEREWYANMAYYYGNQWISWQTTGTFYRMVVPPAPSWRARPIRNRIRPIVRKEAARLTKEKPQGYVIPNSTDSADIAAAIAADAIYRAKWEDLQGDLVMKRAVWWACICGTSFIKDWWDPGRMGKDGVLGEMRAEVLTPFHTLVADMSLENLDDQEWVAHGAIRSAQYIKSTYGVTLNRGNDAEGNQYTSPDWEQRLFRAMGLQGKMTTRDGVLVYEVWIRSNSDFPDGAKFTMTDMEILDIRDYGTDGPEYQHGEYPFSKIGHVQSGRFYDQSVIVDLISPQKEYNRTRGQIIEAKNRMAKPMLTAPMGSIDANKITSAPGQVIFYTPGFNPPEPIALTPLPVYVLEELDRDVADMSDISSQHEISRGDAPGRVEAATAISFLQEQDDSVLSYTTELIELAVERTGKHILSHANQFWDAERTVKATGTNGMLQAMVFSGSDMKENTDFRVLKGSGTPRSVAAKQAFIQDMMGQGFIPPEKGLQMLNMVNTDRLYDELLLDQRHAERENLMLLQQEIPEREQLEESAANVVKMDEEAAAAAEAAAQPYARMSQQVMQMKALQPFAMNVNPYDNHMAHIGEHERELKQQTMTLVDPIIRQLFIIHTLMHYQSMAFQSGIQLDLMDPRLIGLIRGYAPAPPESMEDAQGQGSEQEQLPPR